jgi:hypothetical protein
VQPHNFVKEGTHHRDSRVGVVEGDEMCCLEEPIHRCEDHHLVVHERQAFDEFHGDIAPDHKRNRQGLKQAGRVQMASFVVLAHPTIACTNALSPGTWKSVRKQVEGALDASVAGARGCVGVFWSGHAIVLV